MTHPIHKYEAIAAKWDKILSANDGGKLRRPITVEECCQMVAAMLDETGFTFLIDCDVHLIQIRDHNAKASNGV